MTAELAPRKFSLFDHEVELLALTDELMGYSERGEEPPTELLYAIAGGITATVEKRDRVAAFVRFCESQPKLIDAEIKRLQARKKTIERGIENIYGYIKRVMDATNQKLLEGQNSSFKIRKNPPHVEAPSTFILPDELVNVEVSFKVTRTLYNQIVGELNDMVDEVSITVSPNKKRIAELLKNEQLVEGAKLVQTEKLEIA